MSPGPGIPPDPNNPPRCIIETAPPERDEWTPTKGMTKGSIACAIAGAILGTGWCLLAARRPDVVVAYAHEDAKVMLFLGTMGALTAFVLCWILFAVMHRTSQMVGLVTAVPVVAVMVLATVAKQIAMSGPGVHLPDGLVQGSAWLAPAMFLKSNIGIWAGIAIAVWTFKDGESLFEMFQ